MAPVTMNQSSTRISLQALLAVVALMTAVGAAIASDFSRPWKKLNRALVLDAYEYNSIDWTRMARDKRIVGFIGKGSDGLPPPYRCSGNETELRLCRALWRRYWVARELYQSRRLIAKSLGLKWGAYHLGRPGNPIAQAEHFLEFTQPEPDDLLAIDIEEDDPEKWMSLEDAELFAKHIHARLGRYPILYTNGYTARIIARRRYELPLLSRLPLWYARYIPEIGDYFPAGHWQSYALWQFNSQANCNRRSCPYRVEGTPLDIDVNVAPMTVPELRAAWPFGHLVGDTAVMLASIPGPIARADALNGETRLKYLPVLRQTDQADLMEQYRLAGERAVPEPATGEDDVPYRDLARLRREVRPGDGSAAHPISLGDSLAGGIDYGVLFDLARGHVPEPDPQELLMAALADSYRQADNRRGAPASERDDTPDNPQETGAYATASLPDGLRTASTGLNLPGFSGGTCPTASGTAAPLQCGVGTFQTHQLANGTPATPACSVAQPFCSQRLDLIN